MLTVSKVYESFILLYISYTFWMIFYLAFVCILEICEVIEVWQIRVYIILSVVFAHSVPHSP